MKETSNKVAAKVRLTYSVELTVSAESEDALQEFINQTTPQEAKALAEKQNHTVDESWNEEIITHIQPDSYVDYEYSPATSKKETLWYFTYGSDPSYPFTRGEYVMVLASSYEEAVYKYQKKYPNKVAETVNAAFIYSNAEWLRISAEYYDGVSPADVITN